MAVGVVSMRAGVVAGPGSATLERAPLREAGPGEVLVRVEGCGVCGSNVPVWEGRPWFDYPLPAGAPGHEAWGVVEETGERVAVLGEGGFAEYLVARVDEVVRIPDELAGEPVPGEPLACAMNVFRRSGIRAGERVAILGVGFLGALLVQLAVDAGADVVAIARRRFPLQLARRFGASETAGADEDVVARYGESFDCVIEAAGAQATLDLAGPLAAVRGRIVIAGYHQDGPRRVDMQLWNWRGLDVVNAHERDPQTYLEGMRAALAAVVEGRLDPTPLYTHVFPLEQLGDALEAARARPDGFMKALVTP